MLLAVIIPVTFLPEKKLNRGLVIPAITNVLAITNRLIKKDWEVPSVREDIKKNNATQKISNRITTIYPQYAMRGTVLDEKETTNVESE